jgi:anthranilate phosphoribosyltransferase
MDTHAQIHSSDSAITRGIKAVAIGKRGSKPLSPDLVQEILDELKTGSVPAIAKGAFFGALMIKGLTEDERKLEAIFAPGTLSDPKLLVEALAPDAPDFVKLFCTGLLHGATLSVEDTERLGDFLFSDQPGEGARGIVASILRVRYETPDEYEGLLNSLHKTIEEPFKAPVPKGAPIIQMAEPFDGVDHSNLITPLAAQFIQRLNYRVVSLVGRNSGPKFGNNLLDLARSLRGTFLFNSGGLAGEPPALGWYLNQQNLSNPMDQWVERRQQIIKRPFLSTLERFLNPLNAHIIISSAFHPPYGEKMITICERAGYKGCIIVRNGLEGTMAFPLMRPAKVLCSARQKDGNYKREEIIIRPEDHLDHPVKLEERLTNPSLDKNRELIETYQKNGKTSYQLFDSRIRVTCAGLRKTIEWVENNIQKTEDQRESNDL